MNGMLELNDHLRHHLSADTAFDWLMNCQGTTFREVKHRRTLAFELGGKRYFIKIHRGCGWGEIFKDLLQGKRPITGAQPEWEAIEQLQALGVSTLTLAGKGKRGSNPARQESFVITDELPGMISLEDLIKDWKGMQKRRQIHCKRTLIAVIAEIARTMHAAGMNHRDFYLCHFLLSESELATWVPGQPLTLYLIDLHRVQKRDRVPRRWLHKDLSGLLFSALDSGLTRADTLRFLKQYREAGLREIWKQEKHFWLRVLDHAKKLYRDFHQKAPPRWTDRA